MMDLNRLAFVDVETTGLSPGTDRIVEIGMVTVSGTEVGEWETLIDPGKSLSKQSRLWKAASPQIRDASPSFKEIAGELRDRLAGRIFIAHNARFDHAFINAEFQRLGIDFSPPVVCSLMLSRRFYPSFAGHNLDALMQRHGLKEDIRHRALPDARLIWQFWQVLQAQHSPQAVAAEISSLLEGPVLPGHLDPSIIDRLPDSPGVYVLYGDNQTVLQVAKAHNLRLHLNNYFRIDRASHKSSLISHLVRNITWQVTRGIIGAHLQLKVLSRLAPPSKQRLARTSLYSWQLTPDTCPCLQLVSLAGKTLNDGHCYGAFETERKARNSLRRVAIQRNLCPSLLGIQATDETACTACAAQNELRGSRRAERLKHLTDAVVALAPVRLSQWPYQGPIAVKEHSDIHVFDNWCFLGTATSESDIREILETSRRNFDQSIYAFLSKILGRLPTKRIVQLRRTDFVSWSPRELECDARPQIDQ